MQSLALCPSLVLAMTCSFLPEVPSIELLLQVIEHHILEAVLPLGDPSLQLVEGIVAVTELQEQVLVSPQHGVSERVLTVSFEVLVHILESHDEAFPQLVVVEQLLIFLEAEVLHGVTDQPGELGLALL